MRVYLAAPWANKTEARAAAQTIADAGHTITEPWWDQTPTDDPTELQTQAVRDIQGVLSAHLVIVLQLGPSEGKAVETGIAIASMIPIFVVNASGDGGRGVGKAANLFQTLLPIVDSLDTALEMAKDLEAQYKAMEAEQTEEPASVDNVDAK